MSVQATYTGRFLFYGVLLLLINLNCASEIDPFADEIPFNIVWGETTLQGSQLEKNENLVSLLMTTSNNEKYQCSYVEKRSSTQNVDAETEYEGDSEEELLDVFTSQNLCSYRLENFWTYELCHKSQFRQYHERNDPASATGKIIEQEYILGKYKEPSKTVPTVAEKPPPRGYVMVEGENLPYHEVVLEDGTLCDLINQPRRTVVKYVCAEGAGGDLYEIKEVSTCEYVAIVRISELCEHPSLRPKTKLSNVIDCRSIDDSPVKPAAQVELEKSMIVKPITRVTKVTKKQSAFETKAQQESKRTGIGKSTDQTFLEQFLSGDHCLQGGSGWWLYEFCFGRYAKQFHVDGREKVQQIYLGHWDLDKHLQWLQEHPTRKPKSVQSRKYISLYMTGGDHCEETKRSRSVEVKLKCLPDHGRGSHGVSIYILEPSICEYVLTVESTILCKAIELADRNGIITFSPYSQGLIACVQQMQPRENNS